MHFLTRYFQLVHSLSMKDGDLNRDYPIFHSSSIGVCTSISGRIYIVVKLKNINFYLLNLPLSLTESPTRLLRLRIIASHVARTFFCLNRTSLDLNPTKTHSMVFKVPINNLCILIIFKSHPKNRNCFFF